MGPSPNTALTVVDVKSQSVRLGIAVPQRASTPDLNGWTVVRDGSKQPGLVKGTEFSLSSLITASHGRGRRSYTSSLYSVPKGIK